MSRSGSGGQKLALKLGMVAGIATFGFVVGAVALSKPADSQAWLGGLALALVGGAVGFFVVQSQAGQVAGRVTDLRLAVSKLGRGQAEVRVRVQGQDEVGQLGRSIQHLASDLTALFHEMDQGRGAAATTDPLVREMRDKTLEAQVPEPNGYEADFAIAAGTRGGVDFVGGAGNTVFVMSAEGGHAMSVVAVRLAYDEMIRALESGASARKALSHTNRVLHKKLAESVCAKASVIEMNDGEAKLYQAGYRAPLWILQAGEALEIEGEGLALGLDEGPVFEKGLRPQPIPMSPGVRLVQSNEAGVRSQELLDLVTQHSPKHTMPFMNLVLGQLDAESEDGLREDTVLLTVKGTS
ncbi:MAG: SpoIIE family protein phosphatase [Planctomycetota bacterium]